MVLEEINSHTDRQIDSDRQIFYIFVLYSIELQKGEQLNNLKMLFKDTFFAYEGDPRRKRYELVKLYF